MPDPAPTTLAEPPPDAPRVERPAEPVYAPSNLAGPRGADPTTMALSSFGASVLIHALVVVLAILLIPPIKSFVQAKREQVVVPDATLAEAGKVGGVPNPGLTDDDPTRAAAQDRDPRRATSEDWAKQRSNTLSETLQQASAGETKGAVTALGVGATGGGVSKALTGARGGGPRGLAAFGAPGGGGGSLTKGLFGGVGGNTKNVVYVCDASGSMLGERQVVLVKELQNAIRSLKPSQNFNVAFFQDGRPVLFEERALVPATPANKAKAYEWIRLNYQLVKETQPLPAVDAMLKMTPKPELMFLLTDGEFLEPQKVIDALERLNQDRKTKINTVLLRTDAASSRDEQRTLRAIAERHGGTFRDENANDYLR